MKTAMVNINSKAILDALSTSHQSARQGSMGMYRSETYLSGIIRCKKMPKSMVPVLADALGIPASRLTEPELDKRSPKQAAKRYHAEMEVTSDRLHMVLLFGDQELYSTYSRIKGNTELDLMQAVSYAAHMMYKQAEQEALKKQE